LSSVQIYNELLAGCWGGEYTYKMRIGNFPPSDRNSEMLHSHTHATTVNPAVLLSCLCPTVTCTHVCYCQS